MTEREGLREAVRPGRAAAAGAAAYVVGYLVTYVLVADTIRNSLAEQLLELASDGATIWKLVGWVFYSAQWVTVTVPGLFGGSNAVNLVESVDAFAPSLRAVAPVALLLAGAAVGWTADSAGEGTTRGAAVVLGYLPLALAGALLVRIPLGDARAGPDVIAAAAVGAGLALVLGGLGGTLAAAASDRV